jgi:hypothetical protein
MAIGLRKNLPTYCHLVNTYLPPTWVTSPPVFKATSEALEVARAVSQLVLMAQRFLRQFIYLMDGQREVRLAVYASHILRMTVQAMIDNLVLWESAGSEATMFIQLGRTRAQRNITSSHESFCIAPAPTTRLGKEPIALDYTVSQRSCTCRYASRHTDYTLNGQLQENAIVRLCMTRKPDGFQEEWECTNHVLMPLSIAPIPEQCITLGLSNRNYDFGISTSLEGPRYG